MMENKRGKKIICIDIGGTAIKSGIMDENMNFLRTDVMDTPRGGWKGNIEIPAKCGITAANLLCI